MSIASQIKTFTAIALKELYSLDLDEKLLTVNPTKPEFEGDYTIVLFSFVKSLKRSPEQVGKELGEHLTAKHEVFFQSFNVIKGFLNLTIKNGLWIHFLQTNFLSARFGFKPSNDIRAIVEYSSPNTNKPLHLGHLRNNFLGWSVSEILKANGYDVVKTCVVNDRGIHICKSMLAWKLFANGETPDSTHTKGDHFVGNYYVKFDLEYKKQVSDLVSTGISKEHAEKEAPLMKATQQMLLDWEAGKPDVIELWKKMNHWVYEGFDETYKRIGTDFNKIYYESDTYLLGKGFVEEGLEKKVFFRKEDGSVWIDLTAEGLDEKLVLRKDGTSVYITQDLGLADEKYKDFNYDESIYVIGDEQNHYMKVLKIVLKKLGKPYADGIDHLNYGMVDLPTGRMKSREGTVVDADDLLDEMIGEAEKKTKEQGKTQEFTAQELEELYEIIGTGGLKFFLLKIDPKKRMIFNPEESVDLHGFTATLIQYTHARIKSILRKEKAEPTFIIESDELFPREKELIILLEQFATVLEQAAAEHNPSVIAIYIFSIAKMYNTFYAEHSVINAESPEKKQLRLQLSEFTGNIISSAMHLLGIKVPERM
ncbi:MAG TPA: arginine--tRNA ligase [Chitinophagaceae bacterium]|nr:arginine--tRNA ligase [Chitinophagaceae bacterium]